MSDSPNPPTPPTPPTPSTPPAQPSPPKRHRGRAILLGIVVLAILVLILPVSNLFISHPTGTVLTVTAVGNPQRLAAATIMERDCLDCHSSQARLPIYASFPIAGPLIARDRADGIKYMDMTEELAAPSGSPVSEAALAQIEYVLDHDTMPPTRYTIMHWNKTLSAADRDVIRNWIHGVRKAHYATEGVAPQFATDALQPLPTTMPVDARKVALGNKLFHDVRLSGDNTLSCASCHGLDKGGTDQAKVSTGIRGQLGPINSPTVYNAVFNFKQFWDGRAADLQDQAGGPVANPLEMGSNFDQVTEKLKADPAFVAEFTAVYPAGLNKENITNAIAEFERTLITPNSRFDQYLRGKTDALNAEELEGLALFRDNGCATCHAGKNLGGQSFEPLGRRANYFADRGHTTDADNGRFNVTKNERDRHAFKVPTLRNIALTYPYFHDASQQTLQQAVKAMAKYQAYRPFTDREADRVVSFLKTLTGDYNGKPLGQ